MAIATALASVMRKDLRLEKPMEIPMGWSTARNWGWSMEPCLGSTTASLGSTTASLTASLTVIVPAGDAGLGVPTTSARQAAVRG